MLEQRPDDCRVRLRGGAGQHQGGRPGPALGDGVRQVRVAVDGLHPSIQEQLHAVEMAVASRAVQRSIAPRIDHLQEENATLFLSALPMFVPSLSW